MKAALATRSSIRTSSECQNKHGLRSVSRFLYVYSASAPVYKVHCSGIFLKDDKTDQN